MRKTAQAIRTGDALEPTVSASKQIEPLLSELSRLYLKRFQALQSGDRHGLQAATDQIAAVKIKLSDL